MTRIRKLKLTTQTKRPKNVAVLVVVHFLVQTLGVQGSFGLVGKTGLMELMWLTSGTKIYFLMSTIVNMFVLIKYWV